MFRNSALSHQWLPWLPTCTAYISQDVTAKYVTSAFSKGIEKIQNTVLSRADFWDGLLFETLFSQLWPSLKISAGNVVHSQLAIPISTSRSLSVSLYHYHSISIISIFMTLVTGRGQHRIHWNLANLYPIMFNLNVTETDGGKTTVFVPKC